MLPRWGAVIAATTAHINVDEGGAPERVAGIKILNVPTDDGKLTPELIDREAWGWGDEHRAQPLVVSITQSTELGTLYTVDEIRAIADHVHGLGMRLHLDGARISNAAASLGLPLRDLHARRRRRRAELRRHEERRHARRGHRRARPRGFGRSDVPPQARHAAVVEDAIRLGAAHRPARRRPVAAQRPHSNAMAQRLRAGVEAGVADGSIRGVAFTQPTQANGVFATVPDGVADRLRESFRFYDWDAAKNEVRWMCSFDTTETDIDAFIAAIARETTR